MRPDLRGLEITKREFGKLTGISPDSIPLQPPRLSAYRQPMASICSISFALLCGSSVLLVLQNITIAAFAAFVAAGSGILLGLTVADELYRDGVKFYDSLEALRELFKETQKHKDIIKAIDIMDQLEEAGNKTVAPENRQKVIEALQLTRNDLIRALKTEKILRVNKVFIAQNPDMLASNLAAVRALQISDKAGDWGKLLDQVLQVAVEVQEEMHKLQDRN